MPFPAFLWHAYTIDGLIVLSEWRRELKNIRSR